MGAFGDNLRRERELRGIALSEISESTKISRRWLKALEDEEFEVLPGGVFNRGFVRAYAHFLGINEEEAVADYVAASNEQESPEDRFPLEIHEKPNVPPLNPKRSVVPLLLSVVALVLVVGGWTFWIKRKSQESSLASQQSKTLHEAPTAPAMAVPAASSTLPLTAPLQSSGESKSSVGHDDGAQDLKPTDAVPDHSEIKHKAQPKTPDKQSSINPTQDTSKAFKVLIKAKQKSWISIAADGRMLWEGTLNANKERSASAGKELVLKTGNAAGIDVSYNGKALGTLGKDKEVRTLTFNTAGLQQ